MGHKQEIENYNRQISKSEESDEETYFDNHFQQYVSNFNQQSNSNKARSQTKSPSISSKEKEDKNSSIEATQKFLKAAILMKLKKNEIQANWKENNEPKLIKNSITPKQHEIQPQPSLTSKTPDELRTINVHQIAEQTGYLHRLLSSKRSKTPTVSEYLAKNSKNYQRTKYFESTKQIISENNTKKQQVDNIRAKSNISEQQPQRQEFLLQLGNQDTKIDLSNGIYLKNKKNEEKTIDKKEIISVERDPFLKTNFRRLKLQITRNKEIKLAKQQYQPERHQLDITQLRNSTLQMRKLITAESLCKMKSPNKPLNKQISPKIDSFVDSQKRIFNLATEGEEDRFEKYSIQEQLFEQQQQKERDLRIIKKNQQNLSLSDEQSSKDQHEFEQFSNSDQITQEKEDLKNMQAHNIESHDRLPNQKEEQKYLRQINLCIVQNYLAFAVLLTSKKCIAFKTEGSKQFSPDHQLRLSGFEKINKEKTKSLIVNVEALKKMEDISFNMKQLWIPKKQAMKAGVLIKEQYSKRKNKDIVIWNLQRLLYDLNTTQLADTGQKYAFVYTEELIEIQSLSEIYDTTQLLIVSKQPLFAASLIGKLALLKISPCVIPSPHNNATPCHSKGQNLFPNISQNLSSISNKIKTSRSSENRSLIATSTLNSVSPNEGSQSPSVASQLIDLLSFQIGNQQTNTSYSKMNGKKSEIDSKKLSLPSNEEINEISSKIDPTNLFNREGHSYFLPNKQEITKEAAQRYFSAPRARMSSNLLSQSITPQRKQSLLARLTAATSPQYIERSFILPQRNLK